MFEVPKEQSFYSRASLTREPQSHPILETLGRAMARGWPLSRCFGWSGALDE